MERISLKLNQIKWKHLRKNKGRQNSHNFMVALCINNIKHFIVQLMHTNDKILRLLKQLKL